VRKNEARLGFGDRGLWLRIEAHESAKAKLIVGDAASSCTTDRWPCRAEAIRGVLRLQRGGGGGWSGDVD